MASRITIYGKPGDKATERLRREMRSMSLDCNFLDIRKESVGLEKIQAETGDATVFPKVAITCAHAPGSVYLTNPDLYTLRQTLYAEEVLGITSFWI